MNIGYKIKNLRTEKLMTQSELAGDEITRNMLSQIENGIALPSLTTVIYLAGRLGVSPSFLLADENDDFIYKKNSIMKNIKKAFTDNSFEICRDICVSELEETDDEIELILAYCSINLAIEDICNGKLKHACEEIDRAIIHTKSTVYDTVSIRNTAYVILNFMKKISPTLDSSELYVDTSDKSYTVSAFENAFCKYVISLEHLTSDCFDERLPEEKLYKMHIEAKKKMSEGNFSEALEILERLINSDEVPSKILLYLTSADFEICCREAEDFRGAYEYSQNKISLLESMLSEI